MLDPDMPAQELRLHMGELTAQEERTARAAIRWANALPTTPASEQEVERATMAIAALNIIPDTVSLPMCRSSPIPIAALKQGV
jgi:hypothetical protein